jgi:predicted 3-demethylubiquinone-9 3-methyltransferase (glyoxalase superfamily)
MQKITPFLWFDNQAEEAANFYVSVFKDGKIKQIARYGDAGPGPKGSVMVVDFEINGQEFTALNGGPTFKLSEAVSFVVHCKTQDEVDYYWEKLSADGGAPNQCGWLKDKYGLSWQIPPDVLTTHRPLSTPHCPPLAHLPLAPHPPSSSSSPTATLP